MPTMQPSVTSQLPTSAVEEPDQTSKATEETPKEFGRPSERTRAKFARNDLLISLCCSERQN